MEITFLGTGAGTPSKERNVSALALTLLQEINSIWLFDCGEATQHQLLYTNIKPRKITKIFITHMHGDHIFGLPGFLSSRSFLGGTETLTIYGPPGIEDYVNSSLISSQTHLTYPLVIKEVETGRLIDDEQFIVDCYRLEHGVPSFGYRITEKDRLGELIVEKLRERGIKPGPIYQQIKENPTVVTPDGETLHREHFLGPNKKGRVISVLGDTRYKQEHIAFVKDSDVLVHEATFNDQSAKRAREYFHSTTGQAATIAKEANVGTLLLTHISSRYREEDYPGLLKEARRVFPNTELAHDLFKWTIPHQ
ncbi:MAG TPA: ribonuclease Z [Virgibacillus sp.]|nr:ribonuclease Z [Virgibacillus sp.]